jgi:AcrR family transcriptional regulator
LLDAARDEFLAKGFLAMTMDGIAARAAVSKVSLYRRWKSKDEATADVFRLMSETRVPADRGSLAADVGALVEATIGSPEAAAAARVLMRTMGEISDHPELLALYRTHLFGPASRRFICWWSARGSGRDRRGRDRHCGCGHRRAAVSPFADVAGRSGPAMARAFCRRADARDPVGDCRAARRQRGGRAIGI